MSDKRPPGLQASISGVDPPNQVVATRVYIRYIEATSEQFDHGCQMHGFLSSGFEG